MLYIFAAILPLLSAAVDEMKAFACSELASIAFEMDMDIIEEI